MPQTIADVPETLPPPVNMHRWATITPDGMYRYALTRSWDPDPWTTELHRPVVFIGLNPSTADALVDDPTIRRCVDFTRRWGHAHLTMLNLYAYRATDPGTLIGARGAGVDIVGPLNDGVLATGIEGASRVVAAWGSHRFAHERVAAVRDAAPSPLHCLGRNGDGQPRHPLYLHRNTALEVWYG